MSDPIYTSVAYVSGDRFAVSNAAGDTFAEEFVVGLRVWADCQADGLRLGTVTAAAHDAEAGRTLVTVAIDAGAALTPNLADIRHGNDIPASLCSHAGNHTLGGRDPLPPASTALAGLVRLASAAATQAGADTEKAVTPAGLATAAKGLVSANTTIHVATTGSDVTGTGAASAPFASISKALASIAGKLIASGTTLTIQVADGMYTVSSTIVIDHPDADKIQILGNTSAETTVAIAAIDTTAKTITVAGDYTASIWAGDIIGLTGSSTNGLNGAYVVSAIECTGGNTIITCVEETIASVTYGGVSVVIKPCNRCILLFSADVYGIKFQSATKFKLFNGFTVKNATSSAYAISADSSSTCTIGSKIIVYNWLCGMYSGNASYIEAITSVVKNFTYGAYIDTFSRMSLRAGCIIDGGNTSVMANKVSGCFVESIITRGYSTAAYSPAVNILGNGNSYIST